MYKPFGFTYKVGLSTRNPKKWMGDLKIWDNAEATLKEVLERRMPGKWHINEEDAAFYGPKVGGANDGSLSLFLGIHADRLSSTSN